MGAGEELAGALVHIRQSAFRVDAQHRGGPDLPQHGGKRDAHAMALPAYDQCIKASHVFNLLDARGVISVTERQSYILRVRELAKACGEAWVHTEAGRAEA